ncbi:MAG: 2-aminoadipate transaminase [Oceanospirillaceae bacterium]|jgi:2-aminoadipate transaminase
MTVSRHQLSTRLKRLHSSPIREILSVATGPNMISFAGGLPADSQLPQLASTVSVRSDLQYGASEGEAALRDKIAVDLRERGIDVESSRVIVLSGSQQGIDLVAKLAIDSGTKVGVESPTYLAALQVFSFFGADYLPYSIESIDDAFAAHKPSLLYCVPTFQNPSSHTYTQQQRLKLAQTCDEQGILLFEDDPYRELVYEPCDRTPVVSYLTQSSWVYQSSFSKTLAPGVRLGYLVCSEDLFEPLLILKQAADLHSSRISQRIVLDLLNDTAADKRLEQLRKEYKHRRDYFELCLQRHFSDIAQWMVPAGGLFFWLKLNAKHPLRMADLLPLAIKAGVVFMPGEPFFASGITASGCFRLNFSNTEPQDVDRGLLILGGIIRQALSNNSAQ